jgi:hypothetical protein
MEFNLNHSSNFKPKYHGKYKDKIDFWWISKFFIFNTRGIKLNPIRCIRLTLIESFTSLKTKFQNYDFA